MAQKKSVPWFHRFAKATATAAGKPAAFAVAALIVLVWAAMGPLFGYSDTWQLVINTGTTIVTFLMVFVIQNTQNRDTEALQLKLDELIRANKGARNFLLDLEDMDDEHIEKLRKVYERLARKAKHN
jgi:low affinity Fe/Cu permease